MLENRYDFVFFFDVTNGNPNGDPDSGNMPRMDPESNLGLVSDVCIKRKLRNYVTLAKEAETGFEIYMAEKAILNQTHARAYEAKGLTPEAKKLPKKEQEALSITQWMCDNFFDIRTFGAVMTTDVNVGQVRGPVQLAFAKSIEPIFPLEITITRQSVTNEKDIDKERTMGSKQIVPYGLYRMHGYINAKLAQKTGFSEGDLELLWTAFRDLFEHDRSASHGEMAARKLVVFKHDCALGNAQAHHLFDRVSVQRYEHGKTYEIGTPEAQALPVARQYQDYHIAIDQDNLPAGVEIQEKF